LLYAIDIIAPAVDLPIPGKRINSSNFFGNLFLNSFLIITHYQRLLDYIKPDFVHVLMNGKIIKSGGPELALELEKKGYENFN